MTENDLIRCGWSGADQLYIDYHDLEWGVPEHNDQKLFELLILEGAQAGLSWSTVLHKRKRYREVFDNFDAQKISQYGEADIARLMADPGIIRNKLKIAATIRNAQSFLNIQQQYGSFDSYIWKFTKGKVIKHAYTMLREIPPKTDIAEVMSKDLLANGFKFVGPTICYAFMQAVGIVNDHVVTCFRYNQV